MSDQTQKHKTRLLMEMARHVGRSNMVGMGELYRAVYGKDWTNRINDTRRLRKLIADCQADGVPICSVVSSTGGGYYLASAGSELTDYCTRLQDQALRKLAKVAKLRRVALPDLLGQLRLQSGRPPEAR